MVSDREPTRNGPDWASRYRAEIARLNRTTDREIDAAARYVLCDRDGQPCPRPECAAHGCMEPWPEIGEVGDLPLTRGGQQ